MLVLTRRTLFEPDIACEGTCIYLYTIGVQAMRPYRPSEEPVLDDMHRLERALWLRRR
jgi:hypothetical protein